MLMYAPCGPEPPEGKAASFSQRSHSQARTAQAAAARNTESPDFVAKGIASLASGLHAIRTWVPVPCQMCRALRGGSKTKDFRRLALHRSGFVYFRKAETKQNLKTISELRCPPVETKTPARGTTSGKMGGESRFSPNLQNPKLNQKGLPQLPK
jgi:hypothetical protein